MEALATHYKMRKEVFGLADIEMINEVEQRVKRLARYQQKSVVQLGKRICNDQKSQNEPIWVR
jgi:hypothetical protein